MYLPRAYYINTYKRFNSLLGTSILLGYIMLSKIYIIGTQYAHCTYCV